MKRIALNHVIFMIVSVLFLRGLGELIPDFEPHTVVLVDTLATNLNLYLTDESVTKGVSPCYVVRLCGSGSVDRSKRESRELDLKIDVVNKIAITRNCACDLAAKVCGTGEYLFDRLNGEVCMASVHHFKKCNLRVSRKIFTTLKFPKGNGPYLKSSLKVTYSFSDPLPSGL